MQREEFVSPLLVLGNILVSVRSTEPRAPDFYCGDGGHKQNNHTKFVMPKFSLLFSILIICFIFTFRASPVDLLQFLVNLAPIPSPIFVLTERAVVYGGPETGYRRPRRIIIPTLLFSKRELLRH